MDFRNFWPIWKRKVPPGTESWGDQKSPAYPPVKPRAIWNIVLFLLTLITTIVAGALQDGVNPLENPEQIPKGFPFAFSLMGILLSHELGHYLVAKKNGINVTLPYFIPAPPIPFFIGTFGAFIKMRSPARDRKMLLDIGAAGPLTGVVVSIPFLIYGFLHSQVKIVQGQIGINLGSSLLLWLINRFISGPIPEGYDILIHPVGFAGWIGLFVTSLNLIPVGQLDGGHVAYALLGERQNKISKFVFLALLGLGFLGWPGWFFWGFLLWMMGFRHPSPIEGGSILDRKRKIIGWVTIAVFLLTFIPVPFSGF